MLKPKKNKKRNNNFIGIGIIVIIGLVVGLMTFADSNPSLLLSLQHREAKQAENFVIPTLEPTETPTDTPTPIPQTYQPPTDPVITCTSSAPNCLGKSIQAKQSECSNITCCQVGNNWSVYASTVKCQEDQKTYNASHSNNTNSPLITCVKSFGTFLDTQSDCDSTPNTAPAQPNSQSNTTIPTVAPQPTQQPQPVDATAYNNCRSNAQNTYNQQVQGCVAQYGTFNGADCSQMYQSSEQQALNNCNSYPH